jgi:hypothetical protein
MKYWGQGRYGQGESVGVQSFLLLGRERTWHIDVLDGEKVWKMDPGGEQIFSPGTNIADTIGCSLAPS